MSRWRRWNANPAHNRTGDCAVRAEGRYSRDEGSMDGYGRESMRRGRDSVGRFVSRGENGKEDMLRVMDDMINESRDQRERDILEKAKRSIMDM